MTQTASQLAAAHRYEPRARAERLIASSRVVLAAVSLGAIWLDPTNPVRFKAETYAALSTYLFLAIALRAAVAFRPSILGWVGMPIHVVDMTFGILLVNLTDGASSPFFVYMTFYVAAAAMRWQRFGVVWTTAIAVAAMILLGYYTGVVVRGPDFEANRFFIRVTYLPVIAVLFAYLSMHEATWRNYWIALANWPALPSAGLPDVLARGVARAAALFNVPRAMIVWEEGDEPWHWFTASGPDGVRTWRERPTSDEPLVPEELRNAVFYASLETDSPVYGLRMGDDRVVRADRVTVSGELRERFAMREVLAAPLRSEGFRGRLFLLDSADLTADDLVLAHIVANHITSTAEHYIAARDAVRTSTDEERRRIARDLHDGLLQTLGGLGMQLESLAQNAGPGSGPLVDGLRRLQQITVGEQRDLRFVLGDLRDTTTEESGNLHHAIRTLSERLRAIWGMEVTAHLELADDVVDSQLNWHCERLIREALVNAARHASATKAHVHVVVADGALVISVADNGKGFPFHGRLDHATLTDQRLGPTSLKERVASLGGTLAIDSSLRGSTVSVTIPRSVAVGA